MKLDIFRVVIVASASLAASPHSMYAQLPVSGYTFSSGELLLGFTIPPSTGDLVIDLGKASEAGVGGTNVVDLNAHGNVGKTAAALLSQLNSLYGNMNTLTWGVVGVLGGGSPIIYCTVPHGGLAPVLGAPGPLASAANGAGQAIDGTGTPPNQQVVDPTAGFGTSWTEQIASSGSLWQLNGSNPDSTTSRSFATGVNYQLADLYQRNYTGTVGTPPVYKGYFTLGSDGSLTFTPASSSATTPSATTLAATSITADTATLSASINPNGAATTFSFQYGTNTAYGSQTAVSTLASGTTTISTNAALTGLAASTTYHFRVVATNSAGYALGGDLTFTTAAGVVVMPPQLGGLTFTSGAFGFSFTNAPGLSFSVLATTNVALPLNQWSNLGPVAVTGPGQYRFIDLLATNTQERFYRVTQP